MPTELQNEEQYRRVFDKNREKVLNVALDVRKFEIELYWKRTTYFWTLITATFAGYFVLKNAAPKHPGSIFMITCIGLVLSLSWYLANRGSKYWQENWERHVDVLEGEFIGPLYKTTLSHGQFGLARLLDGFPFSVSKINQLVSLYITLIWLGLTIQSLMSVAFGTERSNRPGLGGIYRRRSLGIDFARRFDAGYFS
jgi:hypothetical protein